MAADHPDEPPTQARRRGEGEAQQRVPPQAFSPACALVFSAVNDTVMQRTLVLMQTQARDDAAHRERRTALYSELARERVMGGLPKPMFANVTKRLGINFQHAPDPELDQRRAELVVPTGIAGGGVSAADFDGDGFTDLYYAGGGGGQLWRNVEGKWFENVTTTSGLTTAGETRAGYFVDYDLSLIHISEPTRPY